MKITNNFSLKEFRCKDGTDVPGDLRAKLDGLCENLQRLRDKIGRPVHIVSGYRTETYNKRVGGVKRSQHLKAKAADLRVSGMTTRELHAEIIKLIRAGEMDPGGVGLYSSFVHYDTRGRNARWYGRGMRP